MERTFFSSLPGWWHFLNISLLALVYITVFFGLRRVIYSSLLVGFIMEFFSFFPFGWQILSLVIVGFLLYQLFTNYFTDFCLYSFVALSLFAVLTRRIIFSLISAGHDQDWLIFTSKTFWLNCGLELIVNMMAATLFFYVISLFGKRLQPVFLSK
ncbi:MAG: hypothetical protein MUF50_03760 [Planctomycetes bacterium]|nr:hypothetical protein [Planctomycetota bacterium]